MSLLRTCRFCGNDYPRALPYCSHCGHFAQFANVEAAEEPEERDALERRYQEAWAQATASGSATELAAFEKAVSASCAVACRKLWDVERMADSDSELYPSYYGLVAGGSRAPADDAWNTLRPRADATLFPGYFQHIRSAALSLDGTGVASYGGCTIVFREEMIAHRATVFDENSILAVERRLASGDVSSVVPRHITRDLPRGYRATWPDRAKLAVAKLGPRITPGMSPQEFPEVLLRQASDSADEQFIEVHIWGSMTRRSFARVLVRISRRGASKAQARVLREKLQNVGVLVESVQ